MNEDTDALNQQPPEKPSFREDGVLDVFDIWYTIQGEGPDAGTPAVFVRLAGCNLGCPNCDADYTSKRKWVTPSQLEREIALLTRRPVFQLVVFTGGEPFRQSIYRAVSSLIHDGNRYRVQVETNGTLPLDFAMPYTQFSIVCSPKTPKIHPDIEYLAQAYKYVIEAGYVNPQDGLPTRALGGMYPARPKKNFNGQIFVQPCDEKDPEKNKANIQAALDSCMKFGYRLSLQLHKQLGLE